MEAGQHNFEWRGTMRTGAAAVSGLRLWSGAVTQTLQLTLAQ
jgi:hypothetical protein